jgi:dethiobiotin synthetase
MKHRILIVGTGTEIGKTRTTALLALGARLSGEDVVALKPIESGVRDMESTDSFLLARACGRERSALYTFDPPVSPHRAAREAGCSIDPSAVARWVSDHARTWTLVESAGGLFSPLGPGRCNADLIGGLECSGVVLVAPGRLGVLHDVTAALLAARAFGMETAPRHGSGPRWSGIVLSPLQGTVEAELQKTELHSVLSDRFGWAPPVLVAPRLPGDPLVEEASAREFWSVARERCFT